MGFGLNIGLAVGSRGGVSGPPAPDALSLSPSLVSTVGGTVVTVTGTDLDDATVTVGGASRTVTPIDSEHFSFVAPAHAAGSVDVVVTTPGGADATPVSLSYQAPVSLTSLATSPTSTAGGATITVLCTNAASVTGVTCDGSARTVTPIDSTHFSFVAQAHAAGSVNVIAQTAIGNSNTITAAYQAPVSLTSLSASPTSTAGGATITVLCTNAANVTACTVDGATRTTTPIDSTHFSFVMPAKAAGTYDVIAQTAIGNSNTITIAAQAPVVLTSCSPDPVSTAGGETVTVLCTNAANVTACTYGGTSCATTGIDGTHFSFVTVAKSAGAQNVIAQTAIGDSNTITDTAQAPVVLTSCSPNPASTVGGETITVLCTNAANVTACTVNGSSRATTGIDSTHFSFVMPALAAGTYNVIAQTAIGNSNTITEDSAAPPFDPTQIGSCKLWLRADLGVTTSSGKVTAWADQSGSGDSARTFTPNGTEKPAYNSSDAGYNGQATIGTFSGVGVFDDAQLKSGVWSQTLTTFSVFVIGDCDTGIFVGNFTIKTANTDEVALIKFASGAAISYGSGSLRTGSGSLVFNAPNLIGGEFNGGSSKLWLNNLATPDGTGTTTGTIGDAAYRLGNNGAGSAHGVRRIAEVIVYDGVLSSGDRTSLRDYLNTRYGMSMS